MPQRSLQPSAVVPVLSGDHMATPWYRFITDLNELALGGGFLSSAAFVDGADTNSVGAVKLYRFMGVAGGTLTLTPSLLGLGSVSSVWSFTIKDEGGNAGLSPITVEGGGVNIDGATSVQITTDYGSVTIYTNGSAYFTV